MLTTKWFEEDNDGVIKTFFLTAEDIHTNKEFLEYKKRAWTVLHSVYSTAEQRTHPFASAIIHFCEYCGPRCPMILVLKEGKKPKDGLPALLKIQSFARVVQAKRNAWQLRSDPVNLFDPSLSAHEKDIRIRKAGIDPATVRRMQGGGM